MTPLETATPSPPEGVPTRLPAWILWILGLLPVRIALAALLPVLPEEAYHWNFARHLDWGYYDHPPMIAWAIAVGRLLFGDTPFGIRFVPLLFAVGTTVLLARFARRVYGEAAATWAVLLFTLAPVPLLVSEAGFPDAPLLFFWTWTMTLAWEALDADRPKLWLAAGAALGGAMLSKYTGVLLAPSALGYLLFSRRDRRWLRTPWPYLAGVTSLIVFLPVVYWNWKHGWVSFLFQSKGRFEESHGFSLHRYVGAQALAMFPLALPLLGLALFRVLRPTRPAEAFFRACFLPMFLFFAFVSCLRPPHVLWPLASYLGLAVVMAGIAAEGEGKIARFYQRARVGLVAVSGILLLAAGIHLVCFLPWISPMQGPYGWKEVAERAKSIRAELPPSAFYLGLGRKYTCTSQLAYQLNLPADVHGAHLIGEPALQYSFWCKPTEMTGRDAVIVIEGDLRAQETLDELQRGFESYQHRGEVVVPVGRSTLRASPPLKFQLYVGRGYRPPPAP